MLGHRLRSCAAINCNFILPADFPHLRCPLCRSKNAPRRPELQRVLTAAQMAARARQMGHHPLPGPPPPPRLPSRAVPTVPPPVIKREPDIDADLALQALLKVSSCLHPCLFPADSNFSLKSDSDDEPDGDPDIIDLSYPEVRSLTPFIRIALTYSSRSSSCIQPLALRLRLYLRFLHVYLIPFLRPNQSLNRLPYLLYRRQSHLFPVGSGGRYPMALPPLQPHPRYDHLHLSTSLQRRYLLYHRCPRGLDHPNRRRPRPRRRGCPESALVPVAPILSVQAPPLRDAWPASRRTGKPRGPAQ